jgi:2-C-methyl-D-erythritol 4-phosphate cytidylyltransferase
MGDEVIVLVHDAARPFPPRSLLEALIGAAEESGGAILALPAPPAVVAARDGLVTGYPADLWAAQTPQAFRLAEIMEAHERAKLEGFQATDTAVLYERVGGRVRVVESSADNIKVTIPADLALAEAIARRLRS